MSSHKGPSVAQILENGKLLPHANALHDDIRRFGEGRFSFWHDYVYLSASDNTNPRTNRRLYQVYWPFRIPNVLAWAVYVLTLLVATTTVVAFLPFYRHLVRLIRDERQQLRDERKIYSKTKKLTTDEHKDDRHQIATSEVMSVSLRKIRGQWVKNASLVIISVFLTILCIEIVFRVKEKVTVAKDHPNTHNQWDEELGWIAEPGVEFTYWIWKEDEKEFETLQKVNEWGFTDQEIPEQWPRDGLRIMVVGDSFVEALQVDMKEKFGKLLEKSLLANLREDVEVVCLGRSGTGQVAQYAYWKKFGPIMRPDILVLVFVANDLRDNHPELTARYYGWNPLHPPRYTAILWDPGPDGLADLPPDRNWRAHNKVLAPRDILRQQSSWASSTALGRFLLSRFFKGKAYLYPWYQTYKGLYVDYAFWSSTLKSDPVIEAGYLITERILNRYARESKSYGTKLIIMIGDAYSLDVTVDQTTSYRTFHDWVARQAERLSVEFISLPEYITENGLDSGDFRCSDGHWNPKGHRLVKELLEQRILAMKREQGV